VSVNFSSDHLLPVIQSELTNQNSIMNYLHSDGISELVVGVIMEIDDGVNLHSQRHAHYLAINISTFI
jgi:hypothetical protein